MSLTRKYGIVGLVTSSVRRHRWVVWVLGCLFLVYLALYLAVGMFLLLFSDEASAVPPPWRDPDVPEAAEVITTTEECASNGCLRRILVRPAEGQTSTELAAEMGLSAPDRQGWRWYDPAAVTVSAETRIEERLTVRVEYAQP